MVYLAKFFSVGGRGDARVHCIGVTFDVHSKRSQDSRLRVLSLSLHLQGLVGECQRPRRLWCKIPLPPRRQRLRWSRAQRHKIRRRLRRIPRLLQEQIPFPLGRVLSRRSKFLRPRHSCRNQPSNNRR
jgi:hypothetical protein